jgi:hypothetical protein
MPWEPGQSGNPGGRAKTKPITDALKAELDQPVRGKSGKTKRQALVERLFLIALTGKRSEALAAMKLILSYTDGLPTQPIELEIRRAAEQIAARTGADPEWLIKRAQEIAAEHSGATS